MAMDYEQKNRYENYMRDGDWHMSSAQTNLGYKYFSQARYHYWEAANCYKEAAYIARQAGDYAEYAASSKQNEAEREFRDVQYKEEKWSKDHMEM